MVNQRELHADTQSYANALRSVLREDPDVVLIGEMRDLETIESALRIAETGHLTFATLHTNSAPQTINRIIDVFPEHQQSQVRAQLSFVLEGIICQSLLPRAGGKGRVLACEVLIPNAAVRNLIREDKVHQIYSTMQTGQLKHGMQTFNQSLATLYQRRLITLQTALSYSSNPEELQDMINRGTGVVQPGGGPASAGEGLDHAQFRMEGTRSRRACPERRPGGRQQGGRARRAAPSADRTHHRQGEGQGDRPARSCGAASTRRPSRSSRGSSR